MKKKNELPRPNLWHPSRSAPEAETRREDPPAVPISGGAFAFGKNKVSLVCTIKNEEKKIEEFLDSIFNQSIPPDEVIITDGGSTDKTVEVISRYVGKGFPITLIKRPGNRSIGRNTAIKGTKNEIIACADAGCKLNKDWLKNITRPLKEDKTIDIVSGWYEPIITNKFEAAQADLLLVSLDEILKNPESFLPSARSIAFRKSSWQKVGGFPENLSWNEDTPFDLKLKKSGLKFNFVSDAVVYWQLRDNPKELWKQIYQYTKGDGESRIFTKNYLIKYLLFISAAILFLSGFYNFIFWIFFIFFLNLYIFYSIYMKKIKIRNLFYSLSIIIIVSTATFWGWTRGMLSKKKDYL